MSDTLANSALSNVRVLDFTSILAGPLCTMILADLGADVIKVEKRGKGDDTRELKPPEDEQGRSAYYLSVNRNKRSLTLDLSKQAGQEIARELVAQSQIVIENFKFGDMEKFGLGYDTLHALYPKLVYATISGFGQTGPYAGRPGYDLVIQAMSGLMSITGQVGREPSKVGVAISDVIAGLFAASSVLAALRHAENTGLGQHIDIPLLDTQIAALVNVASSALVSGETPVRYGNAHANIAPYQVFTASDGDFALAVINDQQFRKLCELVKHLEWADAEIFKTNKARVDNRQTLIQKLSDVFRERKAAEWIDDVVKLNIPAGPINTVSQILADPHIQARGLIHEIDTLRMIGPPVSFSETPATVRTPPPDLGEHTDSILREHLGLSDAEIAAHRADGVI